MIRQIRDGGALIMREGTVMEVVGVKDVIGQVTVVSNKVTTKEGINKISILSSIKVTVCDKHLLNDIRATYTIQNKICTYFHNLRTAPTQLLGLYRHSGTCWSTSPIESLYRQPIFA